MSDSVTVSREYIRLMREQRRIWRAQDAATEQRVGERGIPLPATSQLGDWAIDTGDDGETTVTGPAPLRFTKRSGQRIYHYEVIQWLRHNRDIARSGGTVDLTTGTFRTDTEETP